MKLCARLFCLLRRGAVEAQESLGKALRRFIAVLVGGVNDGQIRCLQLLRSERETAASEIFIGGHSGDKAECPMEVIVGHVYAGCHVGIVNVLINVFFHIVYCLLNQLYRHIVFFLSCRAGLIFNCSPCVKSLYRIAEGKSCSCLRKFVPFEP
jgi:hypothetical protein